jgi:hypothetical protein
MPEPVATMTTRSKRRALKITPRSGEPRIQRCEGGDRMVRAVQSPALEMTMEKPVERLADGTGLVVEGARWLDSVSGIVAKECHSSNGFVDTRIP